MKIVRRALPVVKVGLTVERYMYIAQIKTHIPNPCQLLFSTQVDMKDTGKSICQPSVLEMEKPSLKERVRGLQQARFANRLVGYLVPDETNDNVSRLWQLSQMWPT